MEKAGVSLRAIPIWLIRQYQKWLSPILGPSCRFHPTCSEYGVEAIKIHGIAIGGWLTVKRILKCHPLHPGGFDYVPQKHNSECRHSHSDNKKSNKIE